MVRCKFCFLRWKGLHQKDRRQISIQLENNLQKKKQFQKFQNSDSMAILHFGNFWLIASPENIITEIQQSAEAILMLMNCPHNNVR